MSSVLDTTPALSHGRTIRLMLAIGTLGVGGSEKQLTELIVRLPRDRFDPLLVTSTADRAGDHEARMRAAAIPILGVQPSRGHPLWRWVSLAREYARAVRAARPDVVYAWLDETAAFLAPLCRSLGIPCLVARRNLIGSNLERRYPMAGAALRRAERLATLVTANSAAVAAECVARGHDRARVRVVPNGHEEVPPLPAPREGPVIFGYVAQFRREKGHHRLIDALELMPRGAWRVDLAGAGPLAPEIQQRIAEARLGEHVKLVGRVRDVRDFWRDRHVAMLLSDSEGMPNALLESAFAGRPAIATRTGGSPEVVRDGGILVELNDPAATAAAMQSLMSDAARRERMAIAAWRHVAAAYSMSAMVEGHVAAIDETRALAKPVFA